MNRIRNPHIFLSIVILFACNQKKQKDNDFEGYVDYDVKKQLFDSSQKTITIADLYGATMRCYFKDGNMLKIFYDSNNLECFRYLYNRQSNKFIYSFAKNDRFNWFEYGDKSNKDCEDIRIDSMKPIAVLNQVCPSVMLSFKQKERGETVAYHLTLNYSTSMPFGSEEKLGKITHLNLNLINKRYPFVSIRMTEESVGKYLIVYKANKIVHHLIPDTYFDVPTDKTLKEL